MIIGVGFQKTGTSSLREALKILGHRVKDTSPEALIPILKNDYKKVLKLLEGYSAAEDTPWFMIYKELDELIPNCKFVLTTRESESWYNSVSRHIGDLKAAHHEWIYGRGKSLPKYHKKNTIQVYENHNKEVQAYFQDRPSDLLVLDIRNGDGWKELCTFLNCEVPEQPFPHANNSKAEKEKSAFSKWLRFRRKSLKNGLKIKMITLRGLWPEEK